MVRLPSSPWSGLAQTGQSAQIIGGSQAMGCGGDVQGDRALCTLQFIRWSAVIPNSRPAFFCSFFGISTWGQSPWCQDGMAVSGAVGAGRYDHDGVWELRQLFERSGLSGYGRADHRRFHCLRSHPAQQATERTGKTRQQNPLKSSCPCGAYLRCTATWAEPLFVPLVWHQPKRLNMVLYWATLRN